MPPVRRIPVTITLFAIVLVLLVAGPDPARIGITWSRLGELWRLPLSALVQQDRNWGWFMLAVLPVVGLAELRFGSLAALLLFFGIDALCTIPVLVVLHASGQTRLADGPNVGSSCGVIGALAAWIAALPRRRRDRGAALLAAALLFAAAVDWELAAAQHVLAAVLGGAAGTLLVSRSRGRARAAA